MPIDTPPLRHVSRFRLANGEPDAPAWYSMAQQVATQAAQPSSGAAPQLDGLELLFGPNPAGEAQPTQAAPQAPELNGEDLLFGEARTHETEPASPFVEPDAETWWGRRLQDFRGRQDPREAGIGTVYEQFTDDLRSPTATAAMLGASDAQMSDIIAKQLGDRFIRRETDAHGYDVLVTRGPDGQEQRGYVNAPGLDTQDLWRGVYGATPYVAGGMGIGSLTKGARGVTRFLAHTAGSGGTSVAGDLAQAPLGSEQGVEIGKALFAAGAGGLGVPLEFLASKAWGRFVIEPSLFNRSTGKLTPKGEALAKSQGLDPAAVNGDIARTFAQTYSRTRDASQAAIKAQEGEFGIPSTVGQRSKDSWQLTQEEAMRRNLYGERARDTMQAFDARQSQAVDFASRTRMPSDFRAQAARQDGTMNPAGITNVQQMADNAADLGVGIQSGMRHAREMAEAGEDAAWGAVTDILPTKAAFDLLPNALAGRLGTLRVTSEMPKAASMARGLDDYIGGRAFSDPVAKVLQQSPVKTVDEMRRQLLGMYKGAVDPTDQAAAKAIYDGFNDWIDEAARQSLLAGDAAAAANLLIARDTTRTMQNLFSPSVKGRNTPAAKLMRELETSDSPERAVQILFGPASAQNPSTIKNGAVEALRSMKTALKKYADPRIASDTIADLKVAYWARLVQNNKGNAHSPQVMLNNIKAALSSQRSLVTELYSPAEITQIRRLANELERITYKDPNPSGSGYTAAAFAKQFFGKLLDAIPMARPLYEYSGVPKAVHSVAARRAVDQQLRQTPRNVLPFTSAAGATYGRQAPASEQGTP
ncbi:hypothetical protein [Hyphomicrobium sp. CS1GBMeth3]|uniref:hypothetical protein n=1 Tax=Hyphomicrobium sp. CS1GBMeth3 TaxID=1892845 RepID=UPI0009303C96|nr:hypothetical protein [Hyphomicrobium sp. CS1GBMeth3]